VTCGDVDCRNKKMCELAPGVLVTDLLSGPGPYERLGTSLTLGWLRYNRERRFALAEEKRTCQ